MVYKDPFAQELNINTGLNPSPVPPTSYTPGYSPAPIVAPPVTSNSAPTGIVAPPVDMRSFISQTMKPGYIKGYDTRNNFAPVYVPKGYVPGISATNKDLTTANLNGNTSGYTLPDGTPGTQAQAEQVMAAAKVASDQYTAQQAAKQAQDAILNPPQTELAKQFQSILQGGVDNAQSGVTALQDKQTALNSLNTSDTATQLDDINSQLQQNLAKSAALDLSYQNNNLNAEGSNFTNSGQAVDKAKNYREYVMQKNELAANTLILQGTQAGLQGKYDRAKSLITDAFDSKVALINANTASWKAQADAIQPSLTREENAHLDEVKRYKDKQLKDATDLADAQKQALNDLYDAGVAPDANTTLALHNAKNVNGVQDVMAKFALQLSLAGSLDVQQKQMNLKKTAVDIANVQSEINKRNNPSGDSSSGLNLTPDQVKLQTANQLAFLQDTASKALALADASGQGSLWRSAGSLLKGSTKSSQLAGLEDTLKTNILSLATDPAVKKFFGPQMSEADVRMMMAGGTTLNHITQTPEQAKAEIGRLSDLFTRMSKAVGVAPSNSGSKQVSIGGTNYDVGSIVQNAKGQKGRVNADGTITPQ